MDIRQQKTRGTISAEHQPAEAPNAYLEGGAAEEGDLDGEDKDEYQRDQQEEETHKALKGHRIISLHAAPVTKAMMTPSSHLSERHNIL